MLLGTQAYVQLKALRTAYLSYPTDTRKALASEFNDAVCDVRKTLTRFIALRPSDANVSSLFKSHDDYRALYLLSLKIEYMLKDPNSLGKDGEINLAAYTILEVLEQKMATIYCDATKAAIPMFSDLPFPNVNIGARILCGWSPKTDCADLLSSDKVKKYFERPQVAVTLDDGITLRPVSEVFSCDDNPYGYEAAFTQDELNYIDGYVYSVLGTPLTWRSAKECDEDVRYSDAEIDRHVKYQLRIWFE